MRFFNRSDKFIVVVSIVVVMVAMQGRDLSGKTMQRHAIINTDAFSTLYGHFRRVFSAGNTADTTVGLFYYLEPAKMYIEITYPLRQIMLFEANVTTIYYPVEQKAFRLESANPVILPLVPGLMAAIRPDYGLVDMGFQLTKQEMQRDTVFSLWTHTRAPEKIGKFRIAEVKDRLAYSLYISSDSMSQNKTSFSNYTVVGGMTFPTQIISTIAGRSGKAFEVVTLSELKTDLEIPPLIANFKIPPEITVINRKW